MFMCHYCGKPTTDLCDDLKAFCCEDCWFSDVHQQDIDEHQEEWREWAEENGREP